ncbi:KIR protein [Plasmodium coatneyi]|uniref:KIR protein n=1 Tax=Plasmodium coatneyi TaxID=208452 RepID=A0A1B1DSN5_9APIC|nr:KIR protein [Plasmodium coatneyi]ANQ05752.1 KIR protein [Plasmodium coatneyi]
MPDPAKTSLKVPKLDKSNSDIFFYSKFNKETDKCDGNSTINSIKGKLEMELQSYAGVQDNKEKIIKGVCSASKMEGTSSSPSLYSDRCNFLFFWIGELLSKSLDDILFSTIVQLICTELEKWYTTNGCKILCTSANKDLFLKRKTIFDYYHDNSVILTAILSKDSNCVTKYVPYLEKILPIYNEVKDDCDGNSKTDPYCKEFVTWFKDENDPEQLKTQCDSAQERFGPKPGPRSGPGTTASNVGSTALPTAAIVPSALAAVGLPTIVTFLLYKVQF